MPSKSLSQHRLMEAAAHTPGGYDKVPQSVGREFTEADRETGKSFTQAKAKKSHGPKLHGYGR